MPVILTDYVEEELPAVVVLESTEVLGGDGTNRLGFKMNLRVVLDQVRPEYVRDRIEAKTGRSLPKGLNASQLPGPPGPPFKNADFAMHQSFELLTGQQDTLKLYGEVIARVGIRYDAKAAAVYCKDAQAERIRCEKLPSDVEPLITRLSEKALNKYFANNAVYTFTGDDVATQLAKSRLKNVTTRSGKIVVEVGL